MRTDYTVKMTMQSKDLKGKDAVRAMDLEGAISLNDLTKDGPVEITPSYWYQLEVHNEHSRLNADYMVFVIVDDGGTRYRTGSDVLMNAFMELMEECDDYEIPMEERQVSILRGSTRDGNPFLTVKLA